MDREDESERIAADEYGYKTYLSERFDAARESGSVIEVKSTQFEHESGARGRFRLFKGQHESIVRYDRQESAFYVFALWDNTARPSEVYLTRRKPAKVGRIIGARGGWNRSGHPSGKQMKLPYSQFFDVDSDT